jgi:hypothetical protein
MAGTNIRPTHITLLPPSLPDVVVVLLRDTALAGERGLCALLAFWPFIHHPSKVVRERGRDKICGLSRRSTFDFTSTDSPGGARDTTPERNVQHNVPLGLYSRTTMTSETSVAFG